MLQCTKILIPCMDEKLFHLEQATEIPKNKRKLDELIPDFFSSRKFGIRIAVVCGCDVIWSAEKFSKTLKECAGEWKDQIVNWDSNQSQSVCVTNICASTADENGMDKESVMGAFFGAISTICSNINEMLIDDKDNGDVARAKTCVTKACSHMEIIAKCPQLINNNVFAEEITSQFGDRDNHDVRNGFPTVMILVFLPESVFEMFEDQTNNFFKQIEYVLHYEDLELQKLQKEYTQACAEIERLKAELEEAKKTRDTRIAELEARLKMAEELCEKLRAEVCAVGVLKNENTVLKKENSILQDEKSVLNEALIFEKKKNAIFRQLHSSSCSVWFDIRYERSHHYFQKDEVEMDVNTMENPEYSHFLGRIGTPDHLVDSPKINEETDMAGRADNSVNADLKIESRDNEKEQEKDDNHIQNDNNMSHNVFRKERDDDDRGI